MERMEVKRDYGKPVVLEPYVHQVGGHSCVLKFDEHTICKPLNYREHVIYESLPEEMKEFMPSYQGVVEVEYVEDCDGFVKLVGHPVLNSSTNTSRDAKNSWFFNKPCSSQDPANSDTDSDDESSPPSSKSMKASKRFAVRQVSSGKFEVMDHNGLNFDPKRELRQVLRADHNPVSLNHYKKQLVEMKKKKQKMSKFIVLENLLIGYKYPCVLDLKMGTRQHGDDASEAKRILHMSKCTNSTSSSLGFRICGMRVYRADTDTYLSHTKYFGRQLDEKGVEETLYSYLHNGYYLRTELIPPIVERLRQLHKAVSHQSTFRFYSSSLLIMYDGGGAVSVDSRPAPAESAGVPGCSFHSDSDTLQGLCNPTQQYDEQLECSVDPFDVPHVAKRKLCDIRMIDFAHTTFQGFPGDRTIHNGPDKGYLFGLENIINLFETLKAKGS